MHKLFNAGVLILLCWISVIPQGLTETLFNAQQPAKIHMVVFRGCEEACQGFQRFFTDRALPVQVSVTDITKDNSRLPAILAELKNTKPDLVVTWGTSISVGLIGTRKEYGEATALGSIPVLFMIVANPVGADIISSYETSDRPTVTGVRNRIPEEVQMQTLFSYYFPKRLGVLNSSLELNSTLNTEELTRLAPKLGFEVVALTYPLIDGKPDPTQIPAMMDQFVAQNVDTVYVGSSSFNVEHAAAFTQAALERHLPVFSAYEAMVRDADALMSVANSYANVGKLAASQAAKILFEDAKPGDLSIATLDRFSIFINMRVAQALDIYPPMQLISIAEIIK